MNEFKWYDIFSPFLGVDLTTFYIGGAKKPKRAPLLPANVTTGFGTATANPGTGQYSYTLSPELTQMRDYFYNAANEQKATPEELAYAQQVGDTGQSFFNRGSNMDLAGASSDYYNSMMRLMDPQRMQESSGQADRMFMQGRTGAGIGMGNGYVNPEQYALALAREQQNSQLALQSQDRARALQQDDMNYGLGLSDASNALKMRPYANTNSLFGLGTGIEGLGAKTLDFAGQMTQQQLAAQAQQQAVNNSRVSGGKGGLGGLISTAANAGLGYMTGGVPGAVMGGLQGMAGMAGGGGGGQSGGGGGQLGSAIGNGFSSLWSGSSANSGLGSIFGSSGGWGGATGTPFAMNSNYGSNYSSLLGGNTSSPNYSIGPSW